jgi:protein-disulfide isomerase
MVIIFVAVLAPVASAQTSPAMQPLARFGDRAIYEEDLLPTIWGQLWQLRLQEYDLKIKALTGLLDQELLKDEAKSKGLSTEELLEQVVDRKLPAPSPSEIEEYYVTQKDRLDRPLSEIRPQLEELLAVERRKKAREDYIGHLREKPGVAILLTRPKVEVTVDPLRLKGNPDAPVTIVEFADFQCPYCKAVQETLNGVMDKYQGKVRLAYKDFPLRQIHAQAQQAAEASRCAAEQGKFWEYHDLLYANQERLDPTGLKDQARKAGLNSQQFTACVDSGKFRGQVENDLQAGFISGAAGSPAFYINGNLLFGAQPAVEFEKIIEAQLSRVEAKD